MSKPITVKTLWGWRKNEDNPELMEAWDEYTIDSYPEGFTEACEKAIASWGDDLYAHRYIDLHIDLEEISATFDPPVINAKVRGVGQHAP